MTKPYSTSEDPGDWTFRHTDKSPGRDAIACMYAAASLREQRKQTALLARIDERLKRGGYSLGKSNRK